MDLQKLIILNIVNVNNLITWPAIIMNPLDFSVLTDRIVNGMTVLLSMIKHITIFHRY